MDSLQPVAGATPPTVLIRWIHVACDSSEPPVGPRLAADALQQQPGNVAGADDRGIVHDLRGASPHAAAVDGALPGGAGDAGFLGVGAEEVCRHLLLEAAHGDNSVACGPAKRQARPEPVATQT